MQLSDLPCLSLAIAPLQTLEAGHYALWVVQAPYPGGYLHDDRAWPKSLSQLWQAWHELFSLQPSLGAGRPDFTMGEGEAQPDRLRVLAESSQSSYSSRLMQQFGLELWQWLVSGSIQASFNQSQGIAIGQNRPLRVRLDVRDPNLIGVPWEIMQPQSGKQPIALNQQIFFSRTTSDVDPLVMPQRRQLLNILLVLGQPTLTPQTGLALEEEAAILANAIAQGSQSINGHALLLPGACQVDSLVQPSPETLTDRLESGSYNVFFYAGHGLPGPDGGQLLLNETAQMSGRELAQVLTRCQVTLAVFNACWGAQPDGKSPRSSLAEVLLHHGLPAVLGMRDEIADPEALTFIRTFTQALVNRQPIDQAVAIARQHLLTLYKFNQPVWTLPVLYLHPEFDGQLFRPLDEGVTTELPINCQVKAWIRSLQSPVLSWPILNGLLRVGRKPGNDVVIPERWVSQSHAEIFCRESPESAIDAPTYFLRDFSRYGTLVLADQGWQTVHHQEIPLQSGMQLRFGSSQGQTLEFVVENS